MMNKVVEEAIRPKVDSFVAGLKQRFQEHCSDKMLTVLIMRELGASPRRQSLDQGLCVAEHIRKGEKSVAYESVVALFETVLEHGCEVVMNGHHVAQDFDRAMHEEVPA